LQAAADHLLEVFEGRGLVEVEGLPAKLLFHEPAIMDLLAPSLERLGVRCVHDPETPAFVRSLVASLRSHLGAEAPDEEEIAAELAAPGEIPAADDFDGWRGALDDVLRQGLEWLSGAGWDIPRLAARYFGSAARRDTLFSSEEEPYARIPFLEWVWLDHGPGSGGRSIAEEKLEEPLPTVVRVVLEALVSATTSLYRVVSVQRGESLVLEDLLRGGKVTVHDRGASRGAEVGTGFACRVITLGDFSFMSTPGRVLGPMMLGIAQGFLDSEGLRTTPKGLRDGAHLFGRLWAWSEEYMANVKLANTDGELVVLHEPGRAKPIAPANTPPPELVEALRAHIHDTSLRWIDEPLPALDGLTPRQAVERAAGRRKVQQMIRSIPAVPLGDAGETIEPPRDELRRALGLPEED
jgi:hypothetical protein